MKAPHANEASKVKEYLLLDESTHHEDLANFLFATERDHALHVVNKKRYERILGSLPMDSRFRPRIQKMYDDTNDRITEVESIIESSLADLPKTEDLKNAMTRIQARQNRQGNK